MSDRHDKFRAIYSDNAKAILAYSLCRSSHSEMAADIVAETFTICWAHIDDVPGDAEARFWLYKVARGVLANYGRKKANSEQLGGALKLHLEKTGVGSFADASVDKIVVRQAMAKLSSQDLELIALAHWDELKSNEIGQVMGISATAVRTRLKRARKALKVHIEENAESLSQ